MTLKQGDEIVVEDLLGNPRTLVFSALKVSWPRGGQPVYVATFDDINRLAVEE